MIINSILSVAFVWSCRKCLLQLKELGILRSKIANARVLPVTEALQKIAELQAGRKIFMVIRGLVKIKNKLKGENSIYSLFQQTPVKATKLSEYLRRGSWTDLATSSFWRQPFNLKRLAFELQDMAGEGSKLEIRGVKKSALTGALSQVFKDTQKKQRSPNILLRMVIGIYNFIASRLPFGWVLSPITIGSEITLHAVQDGQYVVVMGQFQKASDGPAFCAFPKYVTKQVGYIQSKLRKRYNRLCLITFLLVLLLGITGIKVVRQLMARFNRWRRQRQSAEQYQQEERSENEGQNCSCALCYTNVRTIIFKPCRHYAVCKFCYSQLTAKSCPFCKKPIEGIIQVIKKK